jgi:putative ABC transport system permease protein
MVHVVRDSMTVTGLGLLIGLLVASGVAQLMKRLLFGIAPLDPLSFLLAPLLLAIVALAACAIPAGRAALIAPARVLRAD